MERKTESTACVKLFIILILSSSLGSGIVAYIILYYSDSLGLPCVNLTLLGLLCSEMKLVSFRGNTGLLLLITVSL